MNDQQIGFWAVSASEVDGNQVVRIHMNDQGEFALAGFGSAHWASCETLILVGIEEEIEARRSFAKLLHVINWPY
jgi:hypothetical protein